MGDYNGFIRGLGSTGCDNYEDYEAMEEGYYGA